jgi:plasmid stability protein
VAAIQRRRLRGGRAVGTSLLFAEIGDIHGYQEPEAKAIIVADGPAATYGTMYGMEKTTVYLPDELKRALRRSAAARGQSEAELIREALRAITAESAPPRPRLPLFASEVPDLAERVDTALDGFGET